MSIVSLSGELTVNEIKKLLGIPKELDSMRVDITPEMAKTLLEKTNKKNRQLRPSTLNYYVRLIRNGDWHLTPDGVSFDSNGLMTNAQHRLGAIVKTGQTMPMFVMFGVEASTAIDTGAKRSFTDNIRIGNDCDERIKDLRLIHMVFNTAYEYRNGRQNSNKLTPDDTIKLMNKYANELLYCYNEGLFDKISTKGCNATIIKSALFLAYLNRVDVSILQRVVDVLKSGIAESDADKPIISLRDKLIPRTGGGREVTQERLLYTQSCIKKLCIGSYTKILKLEPIYTFSFN